MLRRLSGVLAASVLGLACPVAALATAVVFDKDGDVQSAVAPATPAPVAERQRIDVGARVSTSAGKAVLRFDDGLQVALAADTTLRIVDYRYSEKDPWSPDNRVVLELERGAVRVVTGWMAHVNAASFTLRAPQATLTVREGADFTVALVNPMYIAVNVGSVVTANATGKLALAEGSRIVVASANAVPATYSAAALPGPTATAMQNLQLVGLTTPGAAAAGAVPATAGAAGGVGLGTTALGIGAGLAGAAAAASSGGDGGSASTHH